MTFRADFTSQDTSQPSRRDREAEGRWTGRRGSVPVRRDGLDDHDAGPCRSGVADSETFTLRRTRRRRRASVVDAENRAHDFHNMLSIDEPDHAA